MRVALAEDSVLLREGLVRLLRDCGFDVVASYGNADDLLARLRVDPPDVVILDMRPVCSYTDFFVVCTGQNPRQTKAIYDAVREEMKKAEKLTPRTVAGEREASWILADYLDVVLHVFTPEAREYYRLEELWGDVPSVKLAAAG